MENELIYIIGEILTTENFDVKEVTYPKNDKKQERLFFELTSGEKFEITLRKIND